MEDAVILSLELRRPDLRFPLPADFAARAAGRRILSLGRRAKYLLIDLEDDLTIIAHLGMSGSFRIEEEQTAEEAVTPGEFHHPRSKDEKHDHVVFHLQVGDRRVKVIYNDPRRFGFMDMVARSQIDLWPAFAGLGPEPTGNALDAAHLARRFAGKRQPIKLSLLDQTMIAGLGNIYVCEALWRAGISPTRQAASLVTPTGRASKDLSLLVDAIRQVIAEAILAGGSSLRDHIQTDGSLGYFQHSFKVYDREGQPCQTPGCGATVLRMVQGGRSTFYCARCQT